MEDDILDQVEFVFFGVFCLVVTLTKLPLALSG